MNAARSLCALGLVLSLNAGAPLVALSADTTTGGGDAPALHSTTAPGGSGDTPALRSTVTQTECDGPTVNTDDVRVVAPDTELELVLETEITAGETAEGDEFFGKIFKDVLVDGRLVIPRGTLVHGILSAVEV